MTEWQKIETAPINTPVLIYDGKMICVAKWDWMWSESSMALLPHRRNVKSWDCVGARGWEWENDFEEPTHWMPLPDKPAD